MAPDGGDLSVENLECRSSVFRPAALQQGPYEMLSSFRQAEYRTVSRLLDIFHNSGSFIQREQPRYCHLKDTFIQI